MAANTETEKKQGKHEIDEKMWSFRRMPDIDKTTFCPRFIVIAESLFKEYKRSSGCILGLECHHDGGLQRLQ